MNYKNLQTDADEPENFSADDAEIRELLGGLKRVEAPNDFDFRVRARIAKSSSRDFQPRFLPVLRYVLPLGVVLMVSAGFVFNSVYSGDSANNPIVAVKNTPSTLNQNQTIQANPPEDNSALSSPPASENFVAAAAPIKNRTTAVSNVAQQADGKKSVAKTDVKISPENSAPDGGGTRYSALTPPKRVITPPGISLDKTVGDPTSFVKPKSLTAREILLQIGIEAIYENEKWKVLSVQENSPAKRSDIKNGDSVTAIDGEKLTDKPLSTKIIEGKKLTVERGTQRIEIRLDPKTN